jgi:tetratricopeptide (TPR) repeat protein
MNRAAFLALTLLAVVARVPAAEDLRGASDTDFPSTNTIAPAEITSAEPALDQPKPLNGEGTQSAVVETNAVAAPAPAPTQPSAEALVNAAMETLAPAVETLSARLGAIEQTISLQHQRSLETGQAATRTVLLVAGCFALALLLGVLMAALILARAVQRVSEVVLAALPAARQLPGGSSLALPESAEMASGAPAPLDQVTSRFMGAIEKLEKRVIELEHTGSPAPPELADQPTSGSTPASGGGNGGALEFSVSALQERQYGGGNGPKAEEAASQVGDPVTLYLGKGQALLNLGQAEDALACFERALEMNPRHADAYVKRGIALEKLEKMEAALDSYDRAIAADRSLTLAYLYKGAVCNRLQRFREALDCYETALKCEQRLAG